MALGYSLKSGIVIPSALFFLFSTALAKNSKITLNKSRETGHPFLVPDFRANDFSFSPFSRMMAVGLSYITFIMLSYIPSIPSFI
jgi:hypothetical protein